MTVINQDFDLWQGESKILTFRVTDQEGNPENITAPSNIRWVLQATDGTPVLDKSLADASVSVTDGANGEFEVLLEPADTRGIEPDYYEHEARIIDDTGDESVVSTGTVDVEKSLTV